MANKKICIISHASIKDDGRVLKTIDYFLSKGHSVWAIFPVRESFSQISNFKESKFYPIPVRKRDTPFRKILRHTIYPVEFSYLAKEANKVDHKFDYIYVNDLPGLQAGLKIKRKNPGSKLIYDSHEIFNETVNQFFPSDAGIFRSLIYKGFIRTMRFFGTWMESKMVKKVDLFITVNESLKNYFEKKYRVSNIKVMMNCPSIVQPRNEQDIIVDFRKKYGWSAVSRVLDRKSVV